MPKITLSFDIDIDSARKSAKEAGAAIDEVMSKSSGVAQGGDGLGKMTGMFRDISEMIESMSESADKFNKAWRDGLQIDKDRIKATKELSRVRNEMSNLDNRQEAKDKATGGGRDSGGIPGNGGSDGRKYRGGRGGGIGGQAVGFAGQVMMGGTMGSDIAGYASSAASLGAGALGLAGKMGAAGLMYGASKTIEYAQKAIARGENQSAALGGALRGGGAESYEFARRAMMDEAGTGGMGTDILAAGASALAGVKGSHDKGYGMWKYGIAPEEYFQMVGATGGAGGRGVVTDSNMMKMSALKTMFGADTNAVGLLEATRKGGGFEGAEGERKKASVLGDVMGVAMAMRLEDGNIGEAFDMMRSYYGEASSKGVLDVHAAERMMIAMSGLGDRYRGTTSASQGMHGMAQTIASGKAGGPLGEWMGLMSAGFGGEGTDYYAAQAKMGMVGTTRGTSDEDGIKMLRKVASMVHKPGMSLMTLTGIVAKYTEQPAGAIYDALLTDGDGGFVMKFNDITETDRKVAQHKMWVDPAASMVEKGRAAVRDYNTVAGFGGPDKFSDEQVLGVRDRQDEARAWKQQVGLSHLPESADFYDVSRYMSDMDITQFKDVTQQGYAAWDSKAFSSYNAPNREAIASAYKMSIQRSTTQSSAPGAGPDTASANASWLAESKTGKNGRFGAPRRFDYKGPGGTTRLIPNGGTRPHLGYDNRPVGDVKSIYVPHAGTVIRSRFVSNTLGYVVVIELPSDEQKNRGVVSYSMMHLTEPLVSRGQDVQRGDVVAKGLWPLKSKDHIHVSAKATKRNRGGKYGVHVDPMNAIDMESMFVRGIQAPVDDSVNTTTSPGATAAASGGSAAPVHVTVVTNVSPNLAHMVQTDAKAFEAKAMSAAPGDVPALGGHSAE